jgi:predicted flavoprotein YhiN
LQNSYQSVIDVWKNFLALKNVTVFTKAKVAKILWQNSDGTVSVSTDDGRTVAANYVIVTSSLGNRVTR